MEGAQYYLIAVGWKSYFSDFSTTGYGVARLGKDPTIYRVPRTSHILFHFSNKCL